MDERFESLKKYNLWGGSTPQSGFLRDEYTEKITKYIGNRLIKVLVGQRRAGKSYILRQLAMKLVESGVDKKNIFQRVTTKKQITTQEVKENLTVFFHNLSLTVINKATDWFGVDSATNSD